MLTKTLSEAKKKQRNILIKAMNNDIGSIDSAKDSWNPAQISERAKDISYIRSLVDTWNQAQLNEALRMLDLPVIDTWNPAQIEEQRRNLVFYLTERTLTGNPISVKILGNLTPEVTGLKVSMTPIQDLHGYSNPWAGGAGKNKLDLANASLTKPSWYSLGWNAPTLTSDGNGIIQTKAFLDGGAGGFVIDALPSGDYTLSLTADRQNSYVYCGIYYTTTGSDYNEIKTHATVMTQIGTSNRYYLNFTVPSTATQLAFRPTIREHSTPYTIGEIQIESGNQATDFAPYSNICPITGREEVTVTRTAGEDVETKTHEYSETIYGGVDDFVSGGAKSEWGYIASYDGETLPDVWISDRDVYAPDTTPSTGAEVAYRLETPTTISTSAEEITLLKGTNVLSTDGDSIELKYKQNF